MTKGLDEDTLEYIKENIKDESDHDKNIIILNKLDKIYNYKPIGYGIIKKVLDKQKSDTVRYINDAYSSVQRKLSENGFYAEPYYNKKTRDCLAMIPITSLHGDGIPDLMLYLSKCYLEFSRIR